MKVDIQHIEKLLDRYMEGENTQDELRELKDYFLQTKDIPESLLPYKEMFEVLEKPNIIPSVEALDSLLQPKQKSNRAMLLPWIVAACVVGLVIMLLRPSAEKDIDMPHIAKVLPKVAEPQVKQPETMTTTKSEEWFKEKTVSSIKSKKTNAGKSSEQEVSRSENENEDIEIIVPDDEPRAYAASKENTDDERYQDPAKMDEYIAKLAEINNVKKVSLKDASQKDSTMTATVYVFQDSKELDLFGKLLQVACWYKSDSPGYYLNFSQLQFLFQLKDMKKSRSYMWQAERIGHQILVYMVRVPIGAKINSANYKEYRQKLIQQNNMTFYKL
ncbi:MAG: hypothetical protein II900_01920 [Prevotella sp.]|nr:hypothetical protein [Prevotella sp.]